MLPNYLKARMKVNFHKFTVKFHPVFLAYWVLGVSGEKVIGMLSFVFLSLLQLSLPWAEKDSGSAFNSWKFSIINNMFPNLLLFLYRNTLMYFTCMCIILTYTYIYNAQKSLKNRIISMAKKKHFHCNSSVCYSPGL